MGQKIAFTSSEEKIATEARDRLITIYDNCALEEANVIVALGGDGFMLQTLHKTQDLSAPVYGMNRGTVGFLMNAYDEKGLIQRLETSVEENLNPLKMEAITTDGSVKTALAINEVSLLRAGPQAAKLSISVDGKTRMSELISDGVLLSTPAGSTAYNYSANGPILPIGSDVLALTALNAFRPRRWRGALIPKKSSVEVMVLEPEKRPIMADADSRSVKNVARVNISSTDDIQHQILFDPGHGLEERLISEQFN
ncbi:MAG: NAD kinase [Rhodobacteraceae bacterium]|nr:NAD kinase [Paracoccaceae bacterium]